MSFEPFLNLLTGLISAQYSELYSKTDGGSIRLNGTSVYCKFFTLKSMKKGMDRLASGEGKQGLFPVMFENLSNLM